MPSRSRRAYCYWCRRTLTASTDLANTAFTRDHIIPKSRGGRQWVPCCRLCNQLKGAMMPGEWAAWRADHLEWWKLDHRVWRSTRGGLPRVIEAGPVAAGAEG